MTTLKDKVAIVGVGCTETGELWEKSAGDLLVQACYEAFEDAGVAPSDIQAAWLASYGYQPGIGGAALSRHLKFEYIPVSRTTNACATGGDTFRNACCAVAAGLYDIVLVCGVEKTGSKGEMMGGASPESVVGYDTLFFQGAASCFALAATRYAHHYGYTIEQLRRGLARFAVKNYRNGSLNPKAWLRKPLTLEECLNGRPIAYPLGIHDCCANVDGAAALIITRPEVAATMRPDYVLVKGFGLANGARQSVLQSTYDFVHYQENVVASQAAYRMAGIKEPFKEIDLAEIHDAFTIVEAVTMEDLGFAPRGKALEYVTNGVYDLEGELPTNTDGGLKSTGHPTGATGLKSMCEVMTQIQGKAGARQVKNVRLALTHSQGGHPGVYDTIIGIFGARD